MKTFFAFVKQHVFPAVIAMTLALLLGLSEWMQNVENLTLDLRTKSRVSWQPAMADPQQLVVCIDEESLAAYKAWPWPRRVHGLFLALVGQTRPSVISWDILFTEPSEDDSRLIFGLKATEANVIFGAMAGENAVVGEKEADGLLPDDPAVKAARLMPLENVTGDRKNLLTKPRILLPAGELAQLAKSALVDTPPGPDGVRRRVPLMIAIGENVYATLSLQSLMEHWKVQPDEISVRIGESITINNAYARRTIPIDDTGAILLNYRYATEGFHTVGYSNLASSLNKKFVKKEEVTVPETTGRILMVGQVAAGLTDVGPSPFSALTPMVLVHSNVIDNVLREDYAHEVKWWPIWLGAVVLGAGGLRFFTQRKLVAQASFALGVPIIYVGLATLLWVSGSHWLHLVWPLLGFSSLQVFMIARRLIAEQRAKEHIKGMFGTYVSPALVNRMVASGESPQLGGHEDEITAYFSDIQGFSGFSEKLEPAQLVELMNEYLTACTDIVQEEGGTLDKYIGDAVVVMFGAPLPLPDHAFRACVASQRVQKNLRELRVKWESEGSKWPEIVWRMQSRIGLNSGKCIIGNMGSRSRFNYTMMGDNVNLAARMESGAKAWGVYTMCSEATKVACERHGGDRVVFRSLGKVIVMGRSRPVPFYEIVGLKEDVSTQTHECLAIFAEGMTKYYAQDWVGALACFAQSELLEPNVPGKSAGVSSNPSLVFRDKVRYFQEFPPAANWDGVHVAKEK
jgi:adenylate cyclase